MTDILQRFLTLYGEPKTDDPKLFFAEYRKALKGFDPRVLDRASDIVIKAHRYASWPTLGTVIEAAEHVAADMFRSRPEQELRKDDLPPVTDEERTRADAIVKQLFSLTHGNTFENIKARCPAGGTINVSAPWGEEVRDARGNIVPIRRRMA